MEMLSGYMKALQEGRLNNVLKEMYGEECEQDGYNRCRDLFRRMEKWFGDGPALLVSAPGRTELGGNHTDHNHGVVLAAAVHFDCLAAARQTTSGLIRLRSEGFTEVIEVDLDDLSPQPGEEGTSAAIVRGIACALVEAGYNILPFDACLSGNVPVGSGLSSSASFEICIGQIFNHLANNGAISPIELARIGQRAENVHFGKPCGLMDQMASAVQGVVSIDFENSESPIITPVDFDFSTTDYQLVVVDIGVDHSDLTPDYAAIPAEMKRAAGVFGQDTARGLTIDQVLMNAAVIKRVAGDRGLLRLIHFIEESDRAIEQADLLTQGDMEGFLQLVNASGDSSWRLLQNCVSSTNPLGQAIPVALSLSARILEGRGAWRVHGGGFAGTIQAFVPKDRLAAFISVMESVYGPGAVVPLKVRMPGNELLIPEDWSEV